MYNLMTIYYFKRNNICILYKRRCIPECLCKILWVNLPALSDPKRSQVNLRQFSTNLAKLGANLALNKTYNNQCQFDAKFPYCRIIVQILLYGASILFGLRFLQRISFSSQCKCWIEFENHDWHAKVLQIL